MPAVLSPGVALRDRERNTGKRMAEGTAANAAADDFTALADPAVILNVNDDDDARLVTSLLLRRAGFDVIEAATGTEALRMVSEAKPPLVVLDVRLPDINGFEVCRRIKADPATAGTAVLHLSAAHPSETDKVRGLEGGADGYLTVPVEPPVLVATVRSLLRVRHAEARLEAMLARERAARCELEDLAHHLKQTEAALRASEADLRRAAGELRQLNEQLEERVRQRTAELEATLKELEAFSYSVSHDLRAPLRAIGGFSNILLNEYSPQLPREAQRYLQMAVDNVREMSQLVDDLLAFSRTGREPLHKQTVDLKAIAQQSLDALQVEHAGRPVETVLGNLPACKADPVLLKQVFVNLLGNALKFTRDRNPAIIEVGCSRTNGEDVYFVKDNGVGFDMRYADKLFGVFQRLHSAQEYEGTGVGLAIAQRIVVRHGGRMWAEGRVGCGATFYFTLEGFAAAPRLLREA